MHIWPIIGGWFFAFDPDIPVAVTPAIWSPHATALMVILERAPAGFPALTRADVERLTSVAVRVDRPEGQYLVAVTGGTRYRLWLRDGHARQALGYLIIGDEHCGIRRAVAAGFHDQLTTGVGLSASTPLKPGPSGHWRLIQFLRLLDALGDDAPTREQAAALIAADALHFSAAEWDSSRERRRIARWTDKAIAMRDGGFRDLLLGH